MKLLYLSCHAILEYDELKIFEDLNIDYFSLGSYIDPQKPVDPIRPALRKVVNPDILKVAPVREKIPKEFFDKFDVIVIMHGDTPNGNWIELNWQNMRHKRVIWRTIGQSTERLERKMFPYRQDGLQVIRYSKREANINDTVGCDKIIHFYKDPEEFKDYNGLNREVITFAQNMKDRGEYCNFDTFVQYAEGFNAHVYGPRNENAGDLAATFMTYDEMRQKMRDSRVYFYTGTQPASYTLNFIESLMTGMPLICIGSQHGNSLNLAGDTYEIPDFITDGVNGFISDDIEYLRKRTKELLEDVNLARTIGRAGRQTAIAEFGKEIIQSKWKEFLGV